MKKFMQQAIKSAEEGIRKSEGGPFGACIVKKGKVVGVAHNSVLKEQDPTCHAEINAIKKAARKLKKHNLSGSVIYSTTEPCPMCFSAIHWARIDKVIYGTSIQDVKKRGFNELQVPIAKMKRLGKSKIKIKAKFMRKNCQNLLKQWDKSPKKQVY